MESKKKEEQKKDIKEGKEEKIQGWEDNSTQSRKERGGGYKN